MGIFKKGKKKEIDVDALSQLLGQLLQNEQIMAGQIQGLVADRDIIIKATKIRKRFDVLAAEFNRKHAEEQKKNTIAKAGITEDAGKIKKSTAI